MRYNIKDENGVTVNTIVADLAFMVANHAGSFVEATAQDAAPAEPSNAWFISKDKFNSRFTAAETIGLELAQVHNSAATSPVQQLAAALRVVEKQKSDAQYLDLTPDGTNRARIEAGLGYGKSAGVLTDARIAAILVKPAAAERYTG